MTRRIDLSHFDSRPKHEATQFALLAMIDAFRRTLGAGEPIGLVQRQGALSMLSNAHADLELCSTRLSTLLKSVADERYLDHMELLIWINGVSLDLKLAQMDLRVDQYPLPIDRLRLDEGQRLVMALDSCRERLKFY